MSESMQAGPRVLTPDGSDGVARSLLAFEAAHPAHSGAKESAIVAQLGIQPARYYQLLHRAIDTHEALRLDPILTNRLRRVRDHANRTTAARIGQERYTS